jgi:hypothetical protein
LSMALSLPPQPETTGCASWELPVICRQMR